MSDSNEKIELDTPEEILAKTTSLRKEILAKLSGKDDIDSMKMKLAVMDGLDRQALTRLRISSDDKNNDANKSMFDAVTKLLITIQPGKTGSVEIPNTVVPHFPVLDESIPRPVLVDGELEVGIATETVDGFHERMRNKQ